MAEETKVTVLPTAAEGVLRATVHEVVNKIDGSPSDAEISTLAGLALDLIERLNGNVEFARRTWAAAFDEAERLDHNKQLDHDSDE